MKSCVFQIFQRPNTKQEAALEEAGEGQIDYGKWYNSKVVYAYNYIDGDDSIRKKIAILTTCTLLSITAGNPDKKDSSGEYIYRVAPDPSDAHAGLLRPSKNYEQRHLYQAIEDTVAQGADSINIWVGFLT